MHYIMNDSTLKLHVKEYVGLICEEQKSLMSIRTNGIMQKLQNILDAFTSERLGSHHFSSGTGYGHAELGREVIDRIFARVLGAEKAAVRLQFVSGTHAITTALFGVLRPGDSLLSVTGRPYDTLEEVIGLRGSGKGSLMEFGIHYEELNLNETGNCDFFQLENALKIPRRVIFIQRSCGYSWRPYLSIDRIKEICDFVHLKQPNAVCFVDNCYGELVEDREPIEVGADLIAGSLIKNLGGTIVPTGGYVAGKAELVDKACCRLTAPGIGTESGINFDLNRLILQGLFLAPQMVSEALIGADLVAGVFAKLGFAVQPLPGSLQRDMIQAVRLGDPKALKVICKAFQRCSPVGSYLDPVPSEMPGYSSDLLMSGGTFIDGSTSEFSADAPLRPPYILFVQGCSHHSHIKIAVESALIDLIKAGFINLPQNGK